MKYKFEPFKDRKELFLWAAEGKPIQCNGTVFKPNEDGRYCYAIFSNFLSFDRGLIHYQKAIEVKTRTVETNVFFYRDPMGGIYTATDCQPIPFDPEYKSLKSEKFTTEIEL